MILKKSRNSAPVGESVDPQVLLPGYEAGDPVTEQRADVIGPAPQRGE